MVKYSYQPHTRPLECCHNPYSIDLHCGAILQPSGSMEKASSKRQAKSGQAAGLPIFPSCCTPSQPSEACCLSENHFGDCWKYKPESQQSDLLAPPVLIGAGHNVRPSASGLSVEKVL